MLRSDQLADAEDSPGEAGSGCSLPWGHKLSGSHLGDLLLLVDTGDASVILESFL